MGTSKQVDLSLYDGSRHQPGAGLIRRVLWYSANALLFDSWLCPPYAIKRQLLRMFGASIGVGVTIKPKVNIKYPWKLRIGDCSWIGERVWIDNIGPVSIGSHCCVSQGAYLCTGNHDWSDPRFGLKVGPITIADQAWVGAFAVVGPGVSIAEGSVAAAGSVLTRDTTPWMVYAGNPAVAVRRREVGAAVLAK
jgi:putative colanic acid biosynthesis acetyltransferase WcaF